MPLSREALMMAVDDLARRTLGRHMRPRHKPADLDLTLGQMECLRAIAHGDSPTMSEVAEMLQISPSSLTGIIDRLVESGKVQRRDDPGDRRVVRLELTAQGKRDHESHHRHRRQRLMELLGRLDDANLEKLHDALEALDLALRDESQETDA